jgi:hypothetical protein
MICGSAHSWMRVRGKAGRSDSRTRRDVEGEATANYLAELLRGNLREP